MPDLRELYQEMVLDHGRHPRNFRGVEGANRAAEGYNPLCGDKLRLELRVEDGIVQDAAFSGSGCAISTAAASTMTEAVRGRTIAEAEAMFEGFHALVTGEAVKVELPRKLAVFSGVAAYPMRVKCATLAWHTLHAALEGKPIATTE
jgi:nitrogen fixation NifU-like protein